MAKTWLAAAAIFGLALGLAAPALAGDWVALKLRGKVLQLIDGQWQPLRRGDVIPDDRMIRTLVNGRVTFTRDDQTIDLGANTAAQILDFDHDRKTTVWEHFGTVAIEANVETTEHFSVQTKYLAAVVKGTKFVVKADDDHSTVEVLRGKVRVKDSGDGESTMVLAGQQATVSPGQDMALTGVDQHLTSNKHPKADPSQSAALNPTVIEADPVAASPGNATTAAVVVTSPGQSQVQVTTNQNDASATIVLDGANDGSADDTDSADDGNNGHGNDADGVDESNPGKGKGKGKKGGDDSGED
jgi:hypothetical protein